MDLRFTSDGSANNFFNIKILFKLRSMKSAC
jgi:hypothetical protein